MKTFRINTFNFKLFFLTLFMSVSALSAVTFKELDKNKLSEYFVTNIKITCQLTSDQVFQVFQNTNVPQGQAVCFEPDQTGKYKMKAGGDARCTPDVFHARVHPIAQALCPQTQAGATAGSTRPAAGGSSTSAVETVAVIGAVAMAGANLMDVRKKEAAAAKEATKAGGSAVTAAGAGASGQTGAMSAGGATGTTGANVSGAGHNPIAANQAALVSTVDNEGWTRTPDGMRFKTGDGNVAHATITPKGFKEELLIEDSIPGNEKIKTAVYTAPDGSPITLEEYQKGIAEEFQPKGEALANSLPAGGTREAGLAVAKANGKPPLDAKGAADLAAAEASDKEFIAAMTTQITEGITEATSVLNVTISECSALLTGAMACATAAKARLTPSITALQKLKATISTYTPAKTSCSGSATRADNFCSMVRSPTAQAVGMLMAVGGAAISKMSSASETCGTTSNLSQLAQTGMTLANVACTGMKFMCDSSCGSAEKILTGMMAEVKIAAVGAPASSSSLQALLTKEQSAKTGVAPKIIQCQKHAADILQFTTQILGLATAAAQARECKEKLTAGGGTGEGGGAVTMDQMCKDPAQASTLNCKCYANPSAEGCPGAVVKATVNKDGGPLVIKGGGNGSQLAGIDAFRQGSGLSAAAKTALGIDSDSAASTAAGDLNKSSDAFGAAATAANGSSGAAGGLGSGSSGSKDDTAKAEAKDKKFNFGSFGSIGNAIGGFFGGSDSKKSTTGSKFGTEKQIAAAKRQIASDQLRSEISTASGRSNWDKIRTRYVESNSTFIGN